VLVTTQIPVWFRRPPLSEVGRAALGEGLPDLTYEVPPLDPQAELERDASCWRALTASPHCAEIIAEWLEWSRLHDARLSSWAISASRKTWVHLTYAELDKRRWPPHGRLCLINGGCELDHLERAA
jgi:hypothetical protein